MGSRYITSSQPQALRPIDPPAVGRKASNGYPLAVGRNPFDDGVGDRVDDRGAHGGEGAALFFHAKKSFACRDRKSGCYSEELRT